MTTTISSLRENILRRLQSNQVYYAHFVTQEDMNMIAQDTTNEILKLIEKRIDERANHFLNYFDVDTNKIDLLEGRRIDEIPSEVAYLKALVDVKMMLKK